MRSQLARLGMIAVLSSCFTLALTGQGFADEATYEFDEATGVITFTGSGEIPEGFNYNKKDYPNGKLSIKKVIIGPGVTSIGKNAFRGNNQIEAIVIQADSSSQLEIGAQAFYNCSSLSNIEGEMATIKSIGNYAFYNCSALNSVPLESMTTLQSIGMSAFQSTPMSSLSFPASLTTVGNYAFMGCPNIKSVTMPSSITSCGIEVFSNSGLESVEISSTACGESFQNATNLKSITFPEGTTSVSVYDCSSLVELNLPTSVTTLLASNCSSLTELDLPAGIKTLNVLYCTSLTELNLPEGITSLTARGCTSLKTIYIPSSLILWSGTLEDCSGLTDITLHYGTSFTAQVFGMSQNKIPENITFTYLPAVDSTNIPEGAYYRGISGNCTYTFYKEYDVEGNGVLKENVLVVEAQEGTDGVMGDNIKIPSYIGDQAKYVVVKNGVTKIGKSAFQGSYNIEEIYIPKSVTTFESLCFGQCYGLKKFMIEEGSELAAINQAFSGMSGLVLDLSMCTKLDFSTTAGSGLFNTHDTSFKQVILPKNTAELRDLLFFVAQYFASGDRLVREEDSSVIEELVFPMSFKSIGTTAFSSSINFKDFYYTVKRITLQCNASDSLINSLKELGTGTDYNIDSFDIVSVTEHSLEDIHVVSATDTTGASVVGHCAACDEDIVMEPAAAVEWLVNTHIPALEEKSQENADNLSAQIYNLNATITDLNSKIADLEKSLASASVSSSANASAAASLRKQLDEAKAQLATAQEQLATSTSELSQAKADLQTAQGQVATLQEQLKAAQGQNGTDAEAIKQLQQQLTEAQGKLTELQGQLDTSVSETNSLKTQLTEAQDKATGLETQLKDAQSQLGAAQKETSGLQEQVTTLQQQLAASQSALEQAPVVAQTIKVVNNKTVKASKKTGKLAKAKKLTMLKAKGKLTVTKVKGSKKLTLTKSGKIKVKKGTKKGTYKIRVKVKAAASGKYANAVTVVTLEVRVR